MATLWEEVALNALGPHGRVMITGRLLRIDDPEAQKSGKYFAEKYGYSPFEEEQSRLTVTRILTSLRDTLSGREYLVGDTFSRADITTAAMLMLLKAAPQEFFFFTPELRIRLPRQARRRSNVRRGIRLARPHVQEPSRRGGQAVAAADRQMRCPKCSSENPAGTRFCGECGSPFAAKCPKCGVEYSPPAKFCRDCGVPLDAKGATSAAAKPAPGEAAPARELPDPSANEGERKTVTALFADIKGSMEMIENLDPEEARAIVDPALKLMIDAVAPLRRLRCPIDGRRNLRGVRRTNCARGSSAARVVCRFAHAGRPQELLKAAA